MKTIYLLLFVCLLAFSTTHEVSAQLNKKELKQLKKKKKSMSLADFNELIESKNSLEEEVNSLNNKIAQMEAATSKESSELERLKRELADSRSTIAELRSNPPVSAGPVESDQGREPTSTSSGNNSSGNNVTSGVVFRVQIGAFKNKDLSKYFNKEGSFDGETTVDVSKYTLGTFRDYWEADNFKKLLRDMGVSEAWVIPYKDGERVNLRDVLEGAY